MKEKSKSEVSIIGGADGPTSIFIAGRTRKKPLKVRIRNIIYRYRRKIVEKKVVADSHTLDELVQYAMNTYNLIETNSTERKYIEQQKNLKESLILQHKPEVLGEMKDIPKPDISNEKSVGRRIPLAHSDSQKIKENGNAYQPEEKTVTKNRCCMVCWLPCSSGFCWDYSVEFLARQTGIYFGKSSSALKFTLLSSIEIVIV